MCEAAWLNMSPRFYYLSDWLGAAGGCEETSKTGVRGAWGQFKEFAELLTRRGIPLRQKGTVYRSCVQRRLGIEGVVEVMERVRLRWFWHVERKEVDD